MKLVKTGIIITTTLLTMIASLGSTGIHFTNGVLPAVENLPFSDDFNYASISAMVSAGWAQCGGPTPASYYSVSNSLLTLQNDGQAGAAMCWTIQSGATDWTVGERVEATGGLASVTITAVTSYEVNTVLSHHTYRFVADQYTIPAAPNGGQYYLVRDNAVIVTVPGYNPQLNVWHSLRLNMRGNLLTMFFDGAQIGTPYSEPDGTTLTAVNMLATYQATDTFEYVGAADTAFPNGISPFKDDFNYATVNGMLGAGWTNCGNGSPSQYTVGNSVLTLQNDGTNGAGMCWNNLPPGVPNWNASARVEWSGGIYGSIQVDVRTTSHEYRFDADGYTSYRQYLLIRDGAIIVYGPSYSPQLNTWHVLQLNMLNNVLTMYFDGLPVGSQYTEPDSGTSLTSVNAIANWKATDTFDYLTASTYPFIFSLSANPGSANVVKGDAVSSTVGINYVSGVQQTVTLSQTGCPPSATCSFSPASGTPTFVSTLTVATGSSTPVGTYVLTVYGAGGGRFHTSTYTVTVTPSLGDFWSDTGSGTAYFERQTYTSNSAVTEVAPLQIDSNTIYLYYRTHLYQQCHVDITGHNRCQEGSIALAQSFDGGKTFSLYDPCKAANNGSCPGDPIVKVGSIANCDWDSDYVIAPSVVRTDSTHYYLVYEGQRLPYYSTNTSCSIPTGDIGLATSSDGLKWQKQGRIVYHDHGFETGNIGTPFIGYFNNKFYVFYHGYDGLGATFGSSQLGFASGTDIVPTDAGFNLAKSCCNPIMPLLNYGWDTRVNSRASIIYDQASQYYYMTFEGSRSTDCSTSGANWSWGIARSPSLDNPSWTKYIFNPIRQTYNGNNCGNDLPYLFKFNGNIYVYQHEAGQRNILTPGSDPYLTVYLSVNNGQGLCELYHDIGRKDGNPPGWSASTSDPNGWLCYGPSVVLPSGKYAIGFRDMIDVPTGSNGGDHVINQGVYDDTDPNNRFWVFGNDILRQDFAYAYGYQNFYYQFSQTSGHSLQFPTYYYSKAYIRQSLVMVRQIS